jgi:hypothetical protein
VKLQISYPCKVLVTCRNADYENLDRDISALFFAQSSVEKSLVYSANTASWLNSASSAMGTGDRLQPGSEADHSPPSSVEAKKTWVYTSTRPILLHGVVVN